MAHRVGRYDDPQQGQPVTIIRAETAKDAYIKVVNLFLEEGGGITTFYTTNSNSLVRAWFNDVVIVIEDILEPFDMALTGYTFPQRWSKFLKEYTDPVMFPAFLHRAALSQAWTESGYNIPDIARKHAHGMCVVGISARIRDHDKKPMISMHSRASMWTPTGALDLGLAQSTARAILKINPKCTADFGLVWHISLLQTISWKVLLSCALLGLCDMDGNGLPDTPMGNMVKSHAYDSVYDTTKLPNLKMLRRQAMKFGELAKTGRIGKTSAETYFPDIDPFNFSPKGLRTDKNGLSSLPEYQGDLGDYIDDQEENLITEPFDLMDDSFEDIGI